MGEGDSCILEYTVTSKLVYSLALMCCQLVPELIMGLYYTGVPLLLFWCTDPNGDFFFFRAGGGGFLHQTLYILLQVSLFTVWR